jgi:thiamine-phosphate pyrophosphorylase
LRALNDCRLYGILDLGYIAPNECTRVTEQMIDGGVDIVQLRAKKMSILQIVDLAEKIHWITAAASTPLIVNDHAEVARRVPVEGVHLGQDDESIAKVRAAVSYEIIIGKSTHSPEQARAAANEGADYIGFGPLFATPTKPDYAPIGLTDIAKVHVDLALPIFCIGGIKIDNLAEVIAAGAKRVVIVSGLLQAQDIADYARRCKELLCQS